MYSLIVEDDFVSRKIMQKILSAYGECDFAANGLEAIDAFKLAWNKSRPYDLICMDIMMPVVDGQEALRQIRQIEKNLDLKGADAVKVIMTTALNDKKEVFDAMYQGEASSYFVKPIEVADLMKELKVLGLLKTS
jgi:two-component system, chemotaxis family, chemotaxis protein CheY